MKNKHNFYNKSRFIYTNKQITVLSVKIFFHFVLRVRMYLFVGMWVVIEWTTIIIIMSIISSSSFCGIFILLYTFYYIIIKFLYIVFLFSSHTRTPHTYAHTYIMYTYLNYSFYYMHRQTTTNFVIKW